MTEIPYLALVRRWGILVVAATILGAATAMYVSDRMTPTYETTATLLVSQQTQPTGIQRADIDASTLLSRVYAQLIPTQSVLDEAVKHPGLSGLSTDDIRERLKVEQVPNSQLILVSASDSVPARAQLIANTVSAAFIESEAAGLRAETVTVTVAESAGLPQDPVAPRRAINTAGGAMLAFVAAVALVALIEFLDDTLRRPEEAMALVGAPVLGEVEGRSVTGSADRLTAEAYRSIRTGLSVHLGYDEDQGFERRVVLVTSPEEGPGKDAAALNLAIVFGLAGYRTLLVDANLRAPVLHTVLGAPNEHGLSTLLSREGGDELAIRRTPHVGLALLPAGPAPASAVDLLGSAQMRRLVDEFRASYDVVILDIPAMLGDADATSLIPVADVAVVVVQQGRTRGRALQEAAASIAGAGSAVAGVIMDRTPEGRRWFGTSDPAGRPGPLPRGEALASAGAGRSAAAARAEGRVEGEERGR